MWNPSEKSQLATGAGAPRRGAVSALSLAALVLAPLSAFAHCNPTTGHFECPVPAASTPSDLVPGGRLVTNVVSRKQQAGAGGARIKAELVNQRYENKARQRYLWVETALPLPAPGLGIASKAEAQAARLTLRLSHTSVADGAYAECTLEPTKVSARRATYSLGIKANAVAIMLRWGLCDDPQTPGFDSMFPMVAGGDSARLLAPNGAIIAEFAPPIAVDPPMPYQIKKQKAPATARLMEGGSYKTRK
jgi:hypothetical protein